MFIYKLTFSSGKVYIGQTIKTVKHRFNHHRNNVTAGSALPVHNAWRKHGEPTVETIAVCASLDELNAAEIEAIASHGSTVPAGYNLAGGGLNSIVHDATKAKIAQKATGRKAAPDVRAKVAAASKARWQDPAYREKVLAGVKESFTPERRAAIAEHSRRVNTGKEVGAETREKLSKRVITPEWRAKMSEAAKRRIRAPRSAETCAKIAENSRAFWADPENKAARAAQIKAGHAANSAEKRSASAHRAWETKRKKGNSE